MKLVLAVVGRLKAGPERDLFDRYSGRTKCMARSAGITAFEIVEVTEGRGRGADDRRREEAAALEARLRPATYRLVLDERGDAVTSPRFASAIGTSRDAGAACFTVMVGGPDGFDESVRQRADLIMAFGAATLPHQIVRVLAAEQLYRALTILTGHPYHRA